MQWVKSLTKFFISSSHSVLTLALVFLDILALAISFLLAYLLREQGIFRFILDSVQPIEVYLKVLPAAILLLLTSFILYGLYEPKQRLTALSEMYLAFRAVTLWVLLIMAASYLYKYNYSRIIVILFYFFALLLIMAFRMLIRRYQHKLTPLGIVNVLIVGTGRPAREVARRLERYKSVGFNLVGFVSVEGRREKAIGHVSRLYKAIEKYNVSEVYIIEPSLSHEKILSLISKCPLPNIKFKVASNVFDHLSGSIDLANLEGIPSLDLNKLNFPFWKKALKRAFDLIFATLFLLVSLPLWLMIILFIKLESPGKAIFIQERVGLLGKRFKMYKFRTMRRETKVYAHPPKDWDDKRVTKVGRFLRKTSLDELPQMLNVLKGEMSVVGPRPEMPFIVRKYNLWQKRRLLVKPGLTGLWQILGRKNLPLTENLEYDFYYINNQSLILDLVIILKTVPLVLSGKGAY